MNDNNEKPHYFKIIKPYLIAFVICLIISVVGTYIIETARSNVDTSVLKEYDGVITSKRIKTVYRSEGANRHHYYITVTVDADQLSQNQDVSYEMEISEKIYDSHSEGDTIKVYSDNKKNFYYSEGYYTADKVHYNGAFMFIFTAFIGCIFCFITLIVKTVMYLKNRHT